MNTLIALAERESFEVPEFALDHFQKSVLQGLHLEFFLAKCRLIITPHLSFLATGEASASERDRVEAILEEKQDLLEQLKLYLLHNLFLYSALLETNSYYVAVNQHLLICRFLGYAPGVCEVKLYTLPPGDLVERYGDRIYLGRDCLPLDSLQRPHLGLGYLSQSLVEQVEKLKGRLERKVPGPERAALQRDLLGDLEELTEEFVQKAAALRQSYPDRISTEALGLEGLIEVNRDFRELKHVLVDAEILVREAEERLLKQGSHAARYLTKLRKDLINDINYLMLKVNGRISDAVSGIRL
jgi:hypothetical protein